LVFTTEDMAAMKRVKKAFDPEDVYNPNKVIPKLEASLS
jgi:FAD/FMN-containing dehydrogenase